MALLPDGPYIFQVAGIHKLNQTPSGRRMAIFDCNLLGTDLSHPWLIVDTPRARFKWGDVLKDFSQESVEALVGRAFVFMAHKVLSPPGFPSYQPKLELGTPLLEVFEWDQSGVQLIGGRT